MEFQRLLFLRENEKWANSPSALEADVVNVVDVEEVKMKRRKEEEEPAPAEMIGEELEGGRCEMGP